MNCMNNPAAIRSLFRSIVDACSVLVADCIAEDGSHSWMDAARIACENHGVPLDMWSDNTAVALDIVSDCAAGVHDDPDFWAGEFIDAVTNN